MSTREVIHQWKLVHWEIALSLREQSSAQMVTITKSGLMPNSNSEVMLFISHK